MCIDIDGFQTKDTFIVRELGWSDGDTSSCFHYTHDVRFSDLTLKDKRTANYVRYKIHGLTFRPSPREYRYFQLHKQDELRYDIQELYELFATKDKTLVAYKGGHIEKNILQELGIPHIDLET